MEPDQSSTLCGNTSPAETTFRRFLQDFWARLHPDLAKQLHSRVLWRPASSSSPGVDLLRWPRSYAGFDRRMLLVAQASFPKDASMQGFRSSAACKASGLFLSQSSPSIQLSQRRACRLSPLVPTRIHDHLPRCLCLPTGRTNSTDILWTPRARPVGALCILDCACSLMACNLGFCPLVRLSSRSRSS